MRWKTLSRRMRTAARSCLACAIPETRTDCSKSSRRHCSTRPCGAWAAISMKIRRTTGSWARRRSRRCPATGRSICSCGASYRISGWSPPWCTSMCFRACRGRRSIRWQRCSRWRRMGSPRLASSRSGWSLRWGCWRCWWALAWSSTLYMNTILATRSAAGRRSWCRSGCWGERSWCLLAS